MSASTGESVGSLSLQSPVQVEKPSPSVSARVGVALESSQSPWEVLYPSAFRAGGERDRAWWNAQMDAFLPQATAFMDTVGVRGSILAMSEADVLARAGRAVDGYALLEDAWELSASEPPSPLLARVAGIALEAGAYEDAIQTLEGISRSTERTLVKFRLGRAYEAIGDRAKALDAYRTFLSRTAPADEQLGAVIYAREAVTRLGG